MAHTLAGIVSLIPTNVLLALAVIVGAASAAFIGHLLLVKSAKAVFESRARSHRFQ